MERNYKKNMTKNKIENAKKLLRSGELVIFPTETVYGIGGNANDKNAIKKIYKIKKRPTKNPIICHFASIKEINKEFNLNKIEKLLAKKLWPGPITLVLKKKNKSKISNLVSNNSSYVGCRIPKNQLALDLLESLDFPLAAPSANFSERTSVTRFEDLDKKLIKKIFTIRGKQSKLGLESTVIKVKKNNIELLRLGSITASDILKLVNKSKIKFITNSKISPGNLKKHYATKKKIRINVKKIKDDEGLINFGKNNLRSKIINLNLSKKGNLKEASKNLFHFLHKLDQSKCKKIAIAPIPNIELGLTINDRIKRASKK
ncbi:MAG: threonylcarbamoyl-AMP synthase [Pelagibacteraceae bacterium TMED237]|nr:MAG: threonylcarbamoyl-AMP synthase [Pelagibacteraceae bacterium TMED237]|tara:strand:- start:1323 stop:2273 length:951 start_codon:yes stop_codon:yes gene_type:complete